MADKCRLGAPVKFITIDPKVKRLSASDGELHAYTPAVPRQCFHARHFEAAKHREQRLSYVGNVGLAVFVHIEWRIDQTIIDNHLPTVSGDLKAQRTVAVEREQ